MLEGLFGSIRTEQVLLFLTLNQEGYAQEIADHFAAPLSNIQNQLRRLERGGVVVAVPRGRMRFYRFNPRFPFRAELTAMLRKMLDYLPERERQRYLPTRRRPRARRK